jgi:signal transduction histidine kinase
MRTSERNEAESLLVDVVHDLRQPLDTIELSTFLLSSLLEEASPDAREQLRVIKRQVALASTILRETGKSLRRSRDQRTEAESLSFTNAQTAALT